MHLSVAAETLGKLLLATALQIYADRASRLSGQ